MKDEYIRREDAVDALKAQADTMRTWVERYAEQRRGILTAINIVEDIKPADVTPVVHCRDCTKLNRNGYCTRFQNNISGIATSWFMPDDDDFCSYGEYREE